MNRRFLAGKAGFVSTHHGGSDKVTIGSVGQSVTPCTSGDTFDD